MGYQAGQKIKDKTGMRASYTAELVFDDCEVPAENLIGKEGDSIQHMMRNLEIERLTFSRYEFRYCKKSYQRDEHLCYR